MATFALSIHKPAKKRQGFSFVELSVAVIIIGILTTFGFPRLLQSVERNKASEAFHYLAAVQTAQESFHQRTGTYANDFAELDISRNTPAYFTVPATIVADATTWRLQLTRAGANAGYGAYTVTFNEHGYETDTTASSIPTAVNPHRT